MLARSSIYLQNPTASNTSPSPDLLHLSHHHLSLRLLQQRPNWSPGLPYDPCQSILHIAAIVILLEQKSWPASAQHPAVAPHFTQVKANVISSSTYYSPLTLAALSIRAHSCPRAFSQAVPSVWNTICSDIHMAYSHNHLLQSLLGHHLLPESYPDHLKKCNPLLSSYHALESTT